MHDRKGDSGLQRGKVVVAVRQSKLKDQVPQLKNQAPGL